MLLADAALAVERPLSFTIAGPTVETGAHELLLTTTPRFGRPDPFVRFENVVGFAYGFSDRLEAQLLLWLTVETMGLDRRSGEGAVATRWRWQPLGGHADLVGLNLIATVAASPDSVFFEARVGTEKWLGDFLFALNVAADYSVRKDGSAGPEAHLEQSAGVVYRLANRFSTGFEVRNRLGFERGNYFGDAIFAGPVFAFRAKSWWASFAALPQVAAVKAPALYGNGEALELRDNERVVLRFQLGFEVP